MVRKSEAPEVPAPEAPETSSNHTAICLGKCTTPLQESSRLKAALVAVLSRLLAWCPRLAMLLGKLIWRLLPPRSPNGAAGPAPKPRKASRRRLAASAGCTRRPPLGAGELGATGEWAPAVEQ